MLHIGITAFGNAIFEILNKEYTYIRNVQGDDIMINYRIIKLDNKFKITNTKNFLWKFNKILEPLSLTPNINGVFAHYNKQYLDIICDYIELINKLDVNTIAFVERRFEDNEDTEETLLKELGDRSILVDLNDKFYFVKNMAFYIKYLNNIDMYVINNKVLAYGNNQNNIFIKSQPQIKTDILLRVQTLTAGSIIYHYIGNLVRIGTYIGNGNFIPHPHHMYGNTFAVDLVDFIDTHYEIIGLLSFKLVNKKKVDYINECNILVNYANQLMPMKLLSEVI